MLSLLTNKPTGEEGPFVPALEHETLKDKYLKLIQEKSDLNRKIEQLEEAFKQVNSGIHRASEMVEGLAHINDQKVITDLAFTLMKHHPKQLTIKYRGETVTEISESKQ